MFSLIFKVMIFLPLCLHQGLCAKEKTSTTTSKSSETFTSSTTITPAPSALSKETVDQVEASAQLDLTESRPQPKSHSYSRQEHPYSRHRGSSANKNRYEDHAVEYVRDPRPQDEEYYKNSEETNFRQSQPPEQPRHHVEYIDSFEAQYEPPKQQHRNQEHSYEEVPEKGRTQYSGQEPSHYGYQDYSKEDSYESKEGKDRGYQQDARQQYQHQYGHGGSRKKQQATFDPLDVPDSDGHSRYGPGESKVQPPGSYQQQPAYYPRPKPTRYQTTNHKEGVHNLGRHREGNSYQSIPRHAGYAPDEQREPEYLQTSFKKPQHIQQAGYLAHAQHQQAPDPDYPPSSPKQAAGHSQRQHESRHSTPGTGYLIKQHEHILEMLQKKVAASPDGGKVSIHIKHLGRTSLPGGYHQGKERQGFLLLPIVSDDEQKMKSLDKQFFGDNYKSDFQDERDSVYRQRPVQEKEAYFQRDVSVTKHAEESPVVIPQDYPQEYESHRSHSKGFPLPKYGSFRPIVKQTFYENSEYDAPRVPHVQEYSEEVPEGGHPHPVPRTVQTYGHRKDLNTFPKLHLSYEGPHGVIPSFTGAVKYEPVSLYDKPPRYDSPYDVTRAFRALPSKAPQGYQTSFYSSLPRFVDYSKAAEYPSLSPRPKKKNSDTSHLYSTHYRSVANRLTSEYGRLSPQTEAKRTNPVFALQKSQEHVASRHPYHADNRLHRKTLGDLGLQHYESVLSKPKNGRTAVGALYYDLAPHSAQHSVNTMLEDRPEVESGTKKIEIYV